jgi:hypothetical protein
LILTKGLIAISVEEDVKAYLVTREPSRWPGDVKVLYIPFADEDVLYIFDEKEGLWRSEAATGLRNSSQG